MKTRTSVFHFYLLPPRPGMTLTLTPDEWVVYDVVGHCLGFFPLRGFDDSSGLHAWIVDCADLVRPFSAIGGR